MSYKEKERELWTRIIELYKNLPYLWDRAHESYGNRFMRDKGYKLLLEAYREYDNGDCTIPALKKKIENMRTCYYRELKKVRNSAESGVEDIYVPTLWYYDMFHFLHNEPIFETVEMLGDLSDNNASVESNEMPKIQVIERRKPQMNVQMKHEDYIHEIKTKEEEWEIMGKSIAIQLKDLNGQQLTIVNKIISDAIFYAKTNQLTIGSSINLGNKSQDY
ncbi:uncharacterized protein LOC131846417 [Achroia grisella]|uniref:uncharacterized protein LOC131846417 n=1 Tax=Achroia grisella TaxID=688607 RepID=UPI0027D22636|nr:uncharacterized protein LOC131846417 [Achroia grisella]